MDGLHKLPITEIKKCSRCGHEKPLTEFNKRAMSIDGYTAACKECRSIESKITRANLDPVKVTAYGKQYRKRNRKKLAAYFIKYNKENPDTEERILQKKNYEIRNANVLREKRKQWRIKNRHKDRKRMAEKRKNPFFRLKANIRTLISNSIRNHRYTKKSRTFQILGCEFETFKNHMESQFKDGMSWDNIGQWHIDHKRPLALATNEAELLALCHYKNLQPLWAVDNYKKGSKLLVEFA
jgi:hypothetical protein